MGSFMHEILHSVGFYHEHSRPDRCKYLIVDKKVSENINFKELSSEDGTSYGPYDLDSLMHYPEGPYMKLKEEEIRDVKIGLHTFLFVSYNFHVVTNIFLQSGQRERLSKGDIHALNRLYPPGECFRYLIQELGGFISTQPESSYEEAIFDSNGHLQREQYFNKLQSYYLKRVQHMYGLHQKHYPNECTCAFGDAIQHLKKVSRGPHMPNIECRCCKINNPVHDAFGNTSEDVFEEVSENNIQCLKRWVEDYLNANNEREQKVKRKRGEELDIKESEEENTIKKKPKKEQK